MFSSKKQLPYNCLTVLLCPANEILLYQETCSFMTFHIQLRFNLVDWITLQCCFLSSYEKQEISLKNSRLLNAKGHHKGLKSLLQSCRYVLQAVWSCSHFLPAKVLAICTCILSSECSFTLFGTKETWEWTLRVFFIFYSLSASNTSWEINYLTYWIKTR